MTGPRWDESADAGREPVDEAARRTIREDLDRTLFVEAGAGSGKTASLVDRVAALVLCPQRPVALRHVVAVTFSERAADELRGRLRQRFEACLDGERTVASAAALEELDSAAIGTLHAFARRMLTEHAVEAGLPPRLEVLDEVTSGVAFEHRWTALRGELLDDAELGDTVLLGLAAGIHMDDLRSLVRAFTDQWDLIEERVLTGPEPQRLPAYIDVSRLVMQAQALAGMRTHCRTADDPFLARLDALSRWAEQLALATDLSSRLAMLGEVSRMSWSQGVAINWTCDLAGVRKGCVELARHAALLRNTVVHAVLHRLARRIGAIVLRDADARRDQGRLEFHDLLVLARDLLRHPVHGAPVRARLQQRYQRLLLDEFQDTDRIQLELATRIAGGADAGEAGWQDIAVPEGSLFVVGDPKQSIYRFRGADIRNYLQAQQRLGTQVALSTNFRTCAAVLGWINTTFERLFKPSEHSQPVYRSLTAHRQDAPGGPSVVGLGVDAHDDNPSASDVRTREAADVAAVIRTAVGDRWQVRDDDGLRDVALRDIVILVPARTCLPFLEEALTDAGVPYRSLARSPAYRTREVRDLLNLARAVDDPSDALMLVASLRSPLLGCGDDDLWSWHRAGGRWNLLAPAPADVPADHPVGLAVAYLRGLHRDRVWATPSELLARIIEDRRVYEVAARAPGHRDTWRRLRFVVDQARTWSEAERGGLRAYLTWAARQGDGQDRAGEVVPPELDSEAVRIMTVHAAKGLEFPVVVLAGTPSGPGRGSGVEVLWPDDGGYQLRLRGDVQTAEFGSAKPLDQQLAHDERVRLLYVAATRARDHLVVSMHRRRRALPGDGWPWTHAELLADAGARAAGLVPFRATVTPALVPVRRQLADPPPPFAEWERDAVALRERAARPAAVSASRLDGRGRIVTEPSDAGLAKDPKDLDLPPWAKGRYGTAIGRAVHGVLQSVDLATGAGLLQAVAAQVLAEQIPDHADVVTRLALSALASDVVAQAAAARHWKETYVGTRHGDQVLEGVIDLLYRDDGLVIVDYKTDAVPPGTLDERVARYQPQMAAYASALAAATGEQRIRCVLLFLSPDGSIAHEVEDLTLPTLRPAAPPPTTSAPAVPPTTVPAPPPAVPAPPPAVPAPPPAVPAPPPAVPEPAVVPAPVVAAPARAVTESEMRGSTRVQGRMVYVALGTKTQTVNVCRESNVQSDYAHIYRLRRDRAVTVAAVQARASLADLGAWLLERGAVDERAGGRLPVGTPAVPSAARPRPVSPPTLGEPWLAAATRVTEFAVDALLWEFVQHPYLHRVEHSLHARLFQLLAGHPLFAGLMPVGRSSWFTQPVHKEWPETVPRDEKRGRGNFDLAILDPGSVAEASLEQFRDGRIAAPVVIELGLDYPLEHLRSDHDKLVNSRVPAGFLVHFTRGRWPDPQTEAYLLGTERQHRTAYAHHSPDGLCTFKTVAGTVLQTRR